MSQEQSRLRAEPGYESLAAILDNALEQAQSGKGKERHASGEPFDEQPIVGLGRYLGSIHGQCFQIGKKASEAGRLPPEQARRELLGIINYAAAAVIQLDQQMAKDASPMAATPRKRSR